MARTIANETGSSYYPPRARWYSPVFYLGGAIRRRLALDRIRLPGTMTAFGLVTAFLVPGLGVCLRGPRLWGCAALAVCGLLMISFLVGFGYQAGNIAFGLLLSAHVSGFVYYCSPWLANEPFQSRLRFTFLIMIAMGLLIYMPLRSYVLGHWLTSLRVHGKVIVVQRLAKTNDIKSGDWVLYLLREPGMKDDYNYNDGVVVQDGYGWGPVLAGAGDRVMFSKDTFLVNGEARPLLPHMPNSGTLTVPEKHWFIWPEFDISGHGNVGEANISATMLQMATVSQNQFVGKPLNRWLWRRQIAP